MFVECSVYNFCHCLSPIVSKHVDTGYKPKFRQGLLIKHIQELVKTSNGFVSSMHFMLVGGVGKDWLIADCISGSNKSYKLTELVEEL